MTRDGQQGRSSRASASASDLRQLEVQVAGFRARCSRTGRPSSNRSTRSRPDLGRGPGEREAPIVLAGSRGSGRGTRPRGRRPEAVPPAPRRRAPARRRRPDHPLPRPAEAPPPARLPIPRPRLPGAALDLLGPESAEDAEIPGSRARRGRHPEALLRALENYGPRPERRSARGDHQRGGGLRGGNAFVDENARPARSLSLRVRKRDLEDRKAGRISPEELRQRIETTEY